MRPFARMKPLTYCRSLIAALLLLGGMLCGVPAAFAAADPATSEAAAEEPLPVAVLQPLPVGESGSMPWPFSPAWFAVPALLLPAALWLGLAWMRAIHTDPTRLRRLGIRDLRRLLAELRRSAAPPRARDLHRWLNATARAWNLRLSAPTADDVSRAVSELTNDAALTATWRELWCATECGLFAADARLPADWLQRASSAAGQIEVPKRQHRFPDRRDHWIPSMLALAMAAAILVPAPARADDAAVTDYAEVQQAALSALQTNWQDWAAHENLAIYNIQAENWNVAVAHGTISFLLDASTPQVRDNLRVALAQTAMADPTLKRLFFGAWYERLPTLFTAGGWQRLALAAGLLLVAGLATMVFALYRRKRWLLMIVGGSGSAVAALAVVVAAVCWNAYGDLRLSNAGIVMQKVNLNPAPTDLVPQEETAPLAAGMTVQILRSFLGWKQIAAGRDLSGWVRESAVLPVYAER